MFFSSSQPTVSLPKSPEAVPARLCVAAPDVQPDACGWYDSSFDLTTGLEVCEQDSDTLYQLWKLSQH